MRINGYTATFYSLVQRGSLYAGKGCRHPAPRRAGFQLYKNLTSFYLNCNLSKVGLAFIFIEISENAEKVVVDDRRAGCCCVLARAVYLHGCDVGCKRSKFEQVMK